MECQTFLVNATASVTGQNILDANRIGSMDMLELTKVPATDCFKAIGEGVQNITEELETLKATLVHLSAPLGLRFFQGNFAYRGRY